MLLPGQHTRVITAFRIEVFDAPTVAIRTDLVGFI